MLINTQLDDTVAMLLQITAGTQDRRMFHACCNDRTFMRNNGKSAQNGCIVAFRAATGKNNFIRLTAQQCGNLLASFSYCAANLTAKGVHARGITIVIGQVRHHFLQYFRIDTCGCIIIHIYDGTHGSLSV